MFKEECLRVERGLVKVRPVKPSDLKLVEELLQHCSRDTIHDRYGRALASFIREAMRSVGLDGGCKLGLLAVVEEGGVERCVGMAECDVDPFLSIGEVSLIVVDEWQGTGLGRKLLRLIVEQAREAGVAELYGRVAFDNPRMVRLFREAGFEARLSMDDREYRVRLRLKA